MIPLCIHSLLESQLTSARKCAHKLKLLAYIHGISTVLACVYGQIGRIHTFTLLYDGGCETEDCRRAHTRQIFRFASLFKHVL